jgi:N-hydroxyarylamine O-acetyltransferase
MTMPEADAGLDLDRYLARIDYRAPLARDHSTLAGLHLAHATHIPFENLDILLGRPIRLDLPSLQRKLVVAGRGGYCYEQNLLFASALDAIGFPVTMLAARVRYRTTRVLPRTHMLLLVEADDERWIADVGFGGEGLLLPIALRPEIPAPQFVWMYRLQQDGAGFVLQARDREGFHDLYAFTLEPQLAVDYEVASHYVSTHPESRFVRTLAVQLPGPDARRSLRNRTLTIERGYDVQTRSLASDESILAELADGFGLSFHKGTRFPFDESFA